MQQKSATHQEWIQFAFFFVRAFMFIVAELDLSLNICLNIFFVILLSGYCHQDCTLSSMHMNGKVECLVICKQCYHAKVLAQNEISTKSPTTLFPLQGRDCYSAPAITKGMQVKSLLNPWNHCPLSEIRKILSEFRKKVHIRSNLLLFLG